MRPSRFLRFSFALICLGVLALPARADGIADLKRFVAETRSARGGFVQAVHAASGRKPQASRGSFAFSRPGRFRWSVETPFAQLLVGDGSRVWSFDPELNQVTVQPMGAAISGSPASILAGDSDLDKNFELADGGVHDGVAWVEARPRNPESGFSLVRLGLSQGALHMMELRDAFGQTTVLEFVRFETNPALPADTFRFQPPKGADVIGDVGGR